MTFALGRFLNACNRLFTTVDTASANHFSTFGPFTATDFGRLLFDSRLFLSCRESAVRLPSAIQSALAWT